MKHLLIATLIALSVTSAFAQITIKDPWVRATVPQQKATGAFMQLAAQQDARLVEVRSPVAGAVEIHEMTMESNVMKMRAVTGIDLPAGKPVELKPGGYHVMLIDLTQQIKEGDIVPMTLMIEGKDKKREAIELKVPVRSLNSAPGNAHQH